MGQKKGRGSNRKKLGNIPVEVLPVGDYKKEVLPKIRKTIEEHFPEYVSFLNEFQECTERFINNVYSWGPVLFEQPSTYSSDIKQLEKYINYLNEEKDGYFGYDRITIHYSVDSKNRKAQNKLTLRHGVIRHLFFEAILLGTNQSEELKERMKKTISPRRRGSNLYTKIRNSFIKEVNQILIKKEPIDTKGNRVIIIEQILKDVFDIKISKVENII